MARKGTIQNAIVGFLQKHPDRNVQELARMIYQREATTNEMRGIRKAIKALIAAGLIKRSGYYHNGSCYLVTDQARPRPEEKTRLIKAVK